MALNRPPVIKGVVVIEDFVADSLMRPVLIVECSIAIDNTLQHIQAKDQQMIQTFLLAAQHVTLRMKIRVGCLGKYSF